MSTTIHILTVPSSSTFDQPNTLAGQQWKNALSYIARCPSFFCIWWGRHLEVPEHITLLIDWNSNSAAQTFLSEHYASFVTLLQPLVTTRPAKPSAVEINPISLAQPASLPGGGGLTSLTRLTFNTLNADQRYHLTAPMLWVYLQEVCAATDDCVAGFKGYEAGWEVDPTGARTATLWILTSWTSVEAEERCEKELQTVNGLNMKDAFLKELLEKADTGMERHHVGWEMLTPDNLQWWMESDNTIWPYKPLENKEEDVVDREGVKDEQLA